MIRLCHIVKSKVIDHQYQMDIGSRQNHFDVRIPFSTVKWIFHTYWYFLLAYLLISWSSWTLSILKRKQTNTSKNKTKTKTKTKNKTKKTKTKPNKTKNKQTNKQTKQNKNKKDLLVSQSVCPAMHFAVLRSIELKLSRLVGDSSRKVVANFSKRPKE